MDQSGTADGRCPTCGARNPPEATLCPVCGMPLVAAPDARAASAAPREAIDPTPDAATTESTSRAYLDPAHDASRPGTGAEQTRCSWCGALNSKGADACQGCGAAFPRPEQDEALLRASQERIRLANESIATLRQERSRRGLGRLFGR